MKTSSLQTCGKTSLVKVFGKSSFWEPSSSKVIVYFIKGPEIFGVASSIQVEDWNDETGKHYCIFFNVFVLLQVFNEINARSIDDTVSEIVTEWVNEYDDEHVCM